MSSTIIIGGGLSGLTCGLALAKRGHSVTVLSGGPSTLMFSGGSMELLGAIDGQPVTAPLDAIASLPDCHPYRKIGAERIESAPNASPTLPAKPVNCSTM